MRRGCGGTSPRAQREVYSLLSDRVSRQKIQLARRQRGRAQTALISRDKLQANQSQLSTSGGNKNNHGLLFVIVQDKKENDSGVKVFGQGEMFTSQDGSVRLAVPLIHSLEFEMFTSKTSRRKFFSISFFLK